jgi:hypothetical protein
MAGVPGGWVPTAALLLVVVGSHDRQDYVLAYAGLTLMSAVLAEVVNMILPALPLQRPARLLNDLRNTLVGELDALADSSGPPGDVAASTERSSLGHVDHLLAEMRSAVRESAEAADLNRCARNQRETLRGLHRQAQALGQLGFLGQELGLLVDDHDSGGGWLGLAPRSGAPPLRRCAPWLMRGGGDCGQIRLGAHHHGRRRCRPRCRHVPRTPARRHVAPGPAGHQ